MEEEEDGLRVYWVLDTIVDALVYKAIVSNLGHTFLTKIRLIK